MDFKEKIIQAKSIFGKKAIDIISDDLKIEEWDAENSRGRCPFHNESTPSFIWNDKENYFKCFGCGKVYGIIDHYQTMKMSYLQSVKKLFEDTNIDHNFEFDFKDKDYFNNYRYPKEEINTNREKVEEYLKSRKISIETLDFADIKQDSKSNIVFEHRDENGKLLATKYRPSRKVGKKEAKMWWQKNADTCPILYGVDKIDITQPLLVVEGHIDRLACIESGYPNTVSIPIGANSYNWIEFNWEWLEQFDKIIIWADNDTAGKKMIKEVVPRLGEHRCYLVEIPEDIEQKVLETFPKIDVNYVLYLCGKQEVLNIINNAKEVPITDIIDLMDCEDFDISSAEQISTGFNFLNKRIFSHIMGSFNIWTGYTGCVDNKTEFFDGRKWKQISNYEKGDKVLQYNKNGTAELINPIAYIKKPCNEFYLLETKYGVNQCVTPEHNITYLTSKNHLNKISFAELYNRHMDVEKINGFTGKFITTFKKEGKTPIVLSEDEIRLMVAVSADGHFLNKHDNLCRINIKKTRKVERLRHLLNKCKIDFEEKVYNSKIKGYINFYFYSPSKFRIFPAEWYDAPKQQLEIIVDEIYHWDGHKDRNTFFTTIKENADFIQYVITSLGYRSAITTDEREGRNTCYCVGKTNRSDVSIMNRNIEKRLKSIRRYYGHDGYKYCFTVPSGMLVLRRNGRINITGNSGKSTILNQSCIAEPLEAGYDMFLFSGELMKSQLKNWVLTPLAGKNHILEIDNGEYRPKSYNVTREAKNKMETFYKGKIHLYDNFLKSKPEDILSKMEYLFKKKGVKVFIIDNLMCIDFDNTEDKWDAQKNFIMKLIGFTNKYAVTVHLVAHPKKPNGITPLNEYEIFGSSNIPNLTHRIFSVRRVSDKEKEGVMNKSGDFTQEPIKYDSILTVLKDRLTGAKDYNVGLYFDEKTKRFYGDSDNLHKTYQWDDGKIKYNEKTIKKLVSNNNVEDEVLGNIK